MPPMPSDSGNKFSIVTISGISALQKKVICGMRTVNKELIKPDKK